MPLKTYRTIKVITEFTASFHCTRCFKNYSKVKNWEGQVGAAVPVLQIRPNDLIVSVPDLLEEYIGQTVTTRCSDPLCLQRISDGKLEVGRGKYTVLAIDRIDLSLPGGKRLNKLSLFKGRVQKNSFLFTMSELHICPPSPKRGIQ